MVVVKIILQHTYIYTHIVVATRNSWLTLAHKKLSLSLPFALFALSVSLSLLFYAHLRVRLEIKASTKSERSPDGFSI